ncbi:MAG: hypothetical protein ACLP0J_27865 [Solirubrobacteraceae bacterium]
MRTRFAVLATILSALVAVSAPGVASAAPRHNRGLTISATPNPIVVGQGVLIYGQLNESNDAGQTIFLYHRIVPAARFTLVQTAKTDAVGFYDFKRADGVVVSNRYWFVRGPDGTHSRTIKERVAALVTLAANPTAGVTGQAIVFSGHVTPDHPYQRVLIQEQDSLGASGWSTIATAFTGPGSSFTVPHRWARPGIYTLRAIFKGDSRNIAGDSDFVTVTIQQKEKPKFTINSSAPMIADGQLVTISGVLEKASTGLPESSTEVTLWGMAAGGAWQALHTTTTASDGSYSLNQSPIHNIAYKVETTLPPLRQTTVLYEGVEDIVTTSGSSYQTATAGGTLTLTGTVAPDHTGHVIYLQELGSDSAWHNIAAAIVAAGSTYTFTQTFGEAGTFQLRARIYGGPENIGAAAPVVTVMVSGLAPISTLPPAS